MADRYWVGGTGIWDTTTTTSWSTSSGGSGGASVPTADDDVYFDANSGTNTVTITYANAPCKSLSFTSAAGNYAGTFAGSRTIHVYGNLKLSPSMTSTWTGRFEMRGTGSFTVDYNGKSLNNDIFFVTDGSTWQLLSDLTIGSANTLHHQGGTLDVNGKNVSCGAYRSDSSTIARTLNIGTSAITLTGSGMTILNLGGTASIPTTFIGTPTFNCTYSGSTGTRAIIPGGSSSTTEANTPNVNITAGSDIVTFTASHRIRTIDFTGFSGTGTFSGNLYVYGGITVSSNMTFSSGTGFVYFVGTSNTTSTITTNKKTFDYNINFNATGKTWVLADEFTQGASKAFVFASGTLKLKNGATTAVGTFSTSGTTQKYLQSSTEGSQATLSQASGTVNATYIDIKDINATGGATWNALSGAINKGNNTGWNFILMVAKEVFNTIFKPVFRPLFNQ